EAYRKVLVADPAVEDVTGTSGGTRGLTNARFSVRLKPLKERGESAAAVAARLRAKAPLIPGGLMVVFVDQDIRLSGRGGEGEYLFVMHSDSLTDLRKWTKPIGAVMEKLPELTNVNVPGGEEAQQVVLDIDREAARRLGVRMATVTAALNNSFSQRQVATLYDELNQYRVVMEVDPRLGREPAALEQVQVFSTSGKRVPLSAFATWHYGLTQDRVFHDSQFAALSIEYGVAPGFTSQQAQAAIDRAIADLPLPTRIYSSQGPGQHNSLQATLSKQPLLILGVLVTVYLVLGILYESTLHPLTILSTLPSAGLGALLALKLSGTEFSLIALLGLFLLIGVVMKNAILMIDFALATERAHNSSPRDAIYEAAQLRLRPILMTNIAALLGALPLVLATGED